MIRLRYKLKLHLKPVLMLFTRDAIPLGSQCTGVMSYAGLNADMPICPFYFASKSKIWVLSNRQLTVKPQSLHSHNIHLHDKRSQSKVEILPGIIPPTKEHTENEGVWLPDRMLRWFVSLTLLPLPSSGLITSFCGRLSLPKLKKAQIRPTSVAQLLWYLYVCGSQSFGLPAHLNLTLN